MKRITPLLLVLLAAVGCASKKDLETARQELATCQDEKAAAEAAVVNWEQRFDRASTRWDDLEVSVRDALPEALSELQEERERILNLVPEQVESEVAAYLEDYFSTVMKGFELMQSDSRDIKIELAATRTALESMGADTRSINRAVDEALASERASVADERGRRDRVASQLSSLVAMVTEFDRTKVNCKDCPGRLKLSRKERQNLLGFHAELIENLAAVQRFAGLPGIPSSTGLEATDADGQDTDDSTTAPDEGAPQDTSTDSTGEAEAGEG